MQPRWFNVINRTRIDEILKDSRLARNLSGKRNRLIECAADVSFQCLLACDYVEHVSWIIDLAGLETTALQDCLGVTRQYVWGAVDIHALAKVYATIRHDYYHLFTPYDEPAADVMWAGFNALWIGAGRSLEKEGYEVYRKHFMDVKKVAFHVAYAVALQTGGPDLNASDLSLRAAARKRGRMASDEEILWQIGHFLDLVDMDQSDW